MPETAENHPAYVVKAKQLSALYYLDKGHPRPSKLEWINRGTNTKLRKSTVDMLLRTLFRDTATPSVKQLHDSAGLRAVFRSETERQRFAKAFAAAEQNLNKSRDTLVTAVFDKQDEANSAIHRLKHEGVPAEAISLVWRTSQYLDPEYLPSEGHSSASVAGAMAGGGVAGAMLGTAVLLIPGVGPVAVAGALTTSAFSSVAAVTGIIGATGSAIAKMLTDHDVEGVAAGFYEQEIRRGKTFVSVDTSDGDLDRGSILRLLSDDGAMTASAA